MSTQTGLAPLLERFFTQRLMTQRQVSPHTIASYRDTFRLFFLFARQRTKKAPCQLAFSDIDVDLVEAFLADLEQRRGICARSRNLRLSAIRSFFRYAAYYEPAHVARIQQILVIPAKRHDRRLVGFSQPIGSGSPPCSSGFAHMVRSAGSCIATRRFPNRHASIRTDGFAQRRCRVECRRACPVLRERTERALHATDYANGTGIEGVDPRTGARFIRHTIPHRSRPTLERRRRPVLNRQIRRDRAKIVLLAEEKTRDAAYGSTHRSHGASAGWR